MVCGIEVCMFRISLDKHALINKELQHSITAGAVVSKNGPYIACVKADSMALRSIPCLNHPHPQRSSGLHEHHSGQDHVVGSTLALSAKCMTNQQSHTVDWVFLRTQLLSELTLGSQPQLRGYGLVCLAQNLHSCTAKVVPWCKCCTSSTTKCD